MIGREIKQLSYLENGLQNLMMQSDNDGNEEYLLRKFHVQERNNIDYSLKLRMAFTIQRHKNTGEFLLCAKYLAYLFNYQPQYATLVKQFRSDYLRNLYDGINQSQKCLRLICKLMLDQNSALLENIEKSIQSNMFNTEEANFILKFKILEGKIRWQLQKMEKIRNTEGNGQMEAFILNALNFVCKKLNGNINNIIICYKMKFLSLIFDFMGPKIRQYSEEINKTITQWLNVQFYHKDSLNTLYLIIYKSIKHFNSSLFDVIIPYISSNMDHLDNQNFLMIIKEISQTYKQQPKSINIQFIKYVQQNLMQMLINSNKTNNYKAKWMMIDLLIMFYQNFEINFSKKMMNAIMKDDMKNMFLQGLIISIVAIYRPKLQLSEDSKAYIYNNVKQEQIFTDKNKFQFYHMLLDNFSKLHIQFQNFIMNPQTSWGMDLTLLMIKTTVVANFKLLYQKQLQIHLLATLIKLILIDKYYKRKCLQILIELMKQFELHRIINQNNFEISTIIKEMAKLLLIEINSEQKMPQNWFNSLYSIIQVVNKSFPLKQMKSFTIFSTCIELILEIPYQYYNEIFFQQCVQLLQFVLPNQQSMYEHINFQEQNSFLKNFINLMIQCPNIRLFKLYLVILNKMIFSKDGKHFVQWRMSDIQTVYIKSNQYNVYGKFFDNYNIVSFFVRQQPYHPNIEAQVWQIFMKNINHLTLEGNYYLFDVFNNFKYAILQYDAQRNNEFIRINACQSIQKSIYIIRMLNEMAQKAILCEQIEDIIIFRLRMSIRLSQACRYYYYEIQQNVQNIQDLNIFLNQCCLENNMDSFRNIFDGNKKLQKAKSYWHKNQFIFFILSTLVNSKKVQRIASDQMIITFTKNFERIRHQVLNSLMNANYLQCSEKRDIKYNIKSYLNNLEQLFVCNIYQWQKALKTIHIR